MLVPRLLAQIALTIAALSAVGFDSVAAVPPAASNQAASPAGAASSANGVTPNADHHQHLLSPAGAALQNTLLPAVSLPAPLERVIRARAAAWNDRRKLAALFTDDAVALTSEEQGWIRGSPDVARFLSTRFAREYTLTPTLHRGSGTNAYVAGYYMRGDRTLGYWSLVLVKTRGGEWRIAAEHPTFPGPKTHEPQTAAQLVRLLDEAGIRRAAVLSDAYYFDSPKYAAGEPLDRVRAENDWTANQVAQFPDRLVAFCSFNPLRSYALQELERCASSGAVTGLKLHFGMSRVDLTDPEHVRKVRLVVEAANRLRMPIVVHVRADSDYGRREATILLDRIISAAPDVPFQIAHLWGGERYSREALAVYASAVSSGDPRTRHLYFDLAEVALASGAAPDVLNEIAGHIRKIGLSRILYGSDGPVAASMSPRDAWRTTRTLPLTDDEFRVIAGNVAPYLR